MTASTFDPRHPLRSLVNPRDALRPPSSDNPRLGAALSLVAHAGLIAALALGVQWHTQEPEGVAAELWATVPEIAAPPRTEPRPTPEAATTPPPPPPTATPQPAVAEREAQIAIEQARQDQLDKERREALDQRAREKRLREEKERKEQAQKQADQAAEQKRLEREKAEAKQRENDKLAQLKQDKAAADAREKARQDQLRRINEQLGGNGAPSSTGNAARDAGPSASYAGRIIARVRPNIQLLFEVNGNPTTDVRLTVMPDGTITRFEVVKPSGVKEWDEAVLRAIEKTAVLPRDENGRVPSPMTISFSPRPRS